MRARIGTVAPLGALALLLSTGCAGGRAAAPASTAAPAPSGDVFAASPVADWETPPAPGAEATWEAPEAQAFTLPNGLRVVLVENHRLPLVSAALMVEDAGSAADPAGQAGLAALTADLLDEGAGGMSALAIAEAAEQLGASLEVGAGVDGALVRLSTLARTLPESLSLLTTVATRPDFAEAEFRRVHRDRVTDLTLRADRPREVASLLLDAHLYGRESAYGHPVSGYQGSVEPLDRAAVTRFYAARWRPEHMALVVAGDVDRAALQAQLEAGLGTWRPGPAPTLAPEAARTAEETSGGRLILVDRPGAPQTDVRLGLEGPPRDDPRFYALEVLNTILGGGFTSRLNNRLREQLGYTYGAGSAMEYRRQPGPFRIGSALFTPTTADAAREVLTILKGLAEAPVPEAELVKARQNLARALPTRFETNDGIVAELAELVRFGLPLDWYRDYQAQVMSVDAAQVQAAAEELLPVDRLVLVAVGDRSQIQEGLEALFGPALVMDPEGRPVEAP